MTPTMMQGLYDYHRWANRRLCDVAAALGSATERDVGKQFSFPTLKGMFAHIHGADLVWLARWKGAAPTRLLGDADFPSMAALRARWDELETDQRQFVDGLAAADLERIVEYSNLSGTRLRAPLWQLLQHVPNHATHHRSEIATMLTMISGSPPDTGINSYVLAKTGQA
jgi:uncharacterized damage-inducible protein DinB